jgi:hypothetical protein
MDGHVYLLRGILFKDAVVSTARLQNMSENLVVLAGLVQSFRVGFRVQGLGLENLVVFCRPGSMHEV